MKNRHNISLCDGADTLHCENILVMHEKDEFESSSGFYAHFMSHKPSILRQKADYCPWGELNKQYLLSKLDWNFMASKTIQQTFFIREHQSLLRAFHMHGTHYIQKQAYKVQYIAGQ